MTKTDEIGDQAETSPVAPAVAAKEPSAARRRIPAGIWALGFVSLLMDVSSEMIHALLPVYMVAVLGTSTLAVGVIEGIAEAAASITKVFSGALSDWLGKRKLLAVVGYGLAALTKPVFPLATSLDGLVAARFIDRIGKGIRGAPRDALVADIAPPDMRGASFGLRQSLDTVGAFLGPLLAIGLMALSGDDFRLVFWVAVLPAGIGYAMFFGGLVGRRRAVWLLRHGEPQPVRVTAVEATRLTVNGARAFRIQYLPADGAGLERSERHTDSEIVELARQALRAKRTVLLLVDRRRPKRTLWIESLL